MCELVRAASILVLRMKYFRIFLTVVPSEAERNSLTAAIKSPVRQIPGLTRSQWYEFGEFRSRYNSKMQFSVSVCLGRNGRLNDVLKKAVFIANWSLIPHLSTSVCFWGQDGLVKSSSFHKEMCHEYDTQCFSRLGRQRHRCSLQTSKLRSTKACSWVRWRVRRLPRLWWGELKIVTLGDVLTFIKKDGSHERHS